MFFELLSKIELNFSCSNCFDNSLIKILLSSLSKFGLPPNLIICFDKMEFKPTYQEAIKRKKEFLSLGLREYSNLRNYDYGPDRRHNVSGLSPYINHGLINIVDIAEESIDLYGKKNVDKFVSELFWGVYWKGYLELRPTIWSSFKNDLEKLSGVRKDLSYKNLNKLV